MNRTVNPFVIIFVARSGSSVITYDLKQHPNIKMHAEVFGNEKLPGGDVQNDDNRLKYLRQYWSQNPNEENGFLCKGFKYQVSSKKVQFSVPSRLAKFFNENNTKCIFLYRRNRLNHAISALRARHLLKLTKEVEGKANGHIPINSDEKIKSFKKAKIHINLNDLAHMVHSIESNYKHLEHFKSMCNEQLDLNYEDYILDKKSFYSELTNYLDINEFSPTPKFEKITPDDLSLVIQNHDEVIEFYKNLV